MFVLGAFLEKALPTLMLTKTMASIGSAQTARLSRFFQGQDGRQKKIVPETPKNKESVVVDFFGGGFVSSYGSL